MKNLFSITFSLLVACRLVAAPADLRDSLNFNREWKFQLGDAPGAGAMIFDDTKWNDVGLPHSFLMPYFAADKFYVGYGWYRKHFDILVKFLRP